MSDKRKDRQFTAKDKLELVIPNAHTGGVVAVAVLEDQDGPLIISGGDDGAIIGHALSTGT